jgi:pimeloyl-ACP methyl ester carboxylesterase
MMTFLIAAAILVILILGGLVIFAAVTARRVELALPPRGRFLDVPGARIHYLDQGSGPSIVLVHGLGGQMGNFTHSLVERLTDDFRVIVIDRPGSGYSTRARDEFARINLQAEMVTQFIRGLGLGSPLLVGHSLGGAISLAVALNHPECVSGLALLAPLTHMPDAVAAPFRGLEINSKILRRAVAWTLATPLSIRRGKSVLDAIFSPETAPLDFPTKAGGLLGLRPRSFYNTSTDMVSVGADLPAMAGRYASLKVPVSILYGTSDAVLDYEFHGVAMRNKVPGLHLELVAGGHMLPVAAPDVTASFIRRAAQRQTVLA